MRKGRKKIAHEVYVRTPAGESVCLGTVATTSAQEAINAIAMYDPSYNPHEKTITMGQLFARQLKYV